MAKGRNRTDYVRIASSIFIDKFQAEYGNNPTGIAYNKYITLLHRELKADGIDIGLSHCWYRWGDAVVRYSLPYIDWTHDDLDVTKVSFRGFRPNINLNDPIVRRSNEFAINFIKEYKNDMDGVERMIDEVYSDAPFPFQNDYRMLRDSLKISRHNVGYSNFNEYILSLLDKALSSFPKEFSSIRKQKDDFSNVFKEAINNGANKEDLFEMAENFWFFFCYYLRVNNKCHENVSRETLNIWRSRIPDENGRFESSIQNYAFQFCKDSSNPVVKGLLEARTRRLTELTELFDELE